MTPQARDGGGPASCEARSGWPRTGGSKVKKTLAKVAGGLGAATLAIGALHMPFARTLVMRIGGCPLAGAKITPAQMDHARHMALAGRRGTTDAPARPALGFALDSTTLADVHSWAAREHVDCEEPRAGLVTCVDVRPRAVGRDDAAGKIDELALGFDARGHLVNVTTLRSGLEPEAAARAGGGIVSSLEASLGAPDKKAGDFVTAHLAQAGAASLVTRSYLYDDYVAGVTAIRVPPSGLALREHYMSARD
jgi:hypothetical protein